LTQRQIAETELSHGGDGWQEIVFRREDGACVFGREMKNLCDVSVPDQRLQHVLSVPTAATDWTGCCCILQQMQGDALYTLSFTVWASALVGVVRERAGAET
jgi:hypothetical protein